MQRVNEENYKSLPQSLTVIWCKGCNAEYAVRCWDDWAFSDETCPNCGTHRGIEEDGAFDTHCETIRERFDFVEV